MTALNKPLTRRVDADRGRIPLAITIHPAGFFEFREKGRRHSYTLPIMTAYFHAVQAEAAKKKAEKQAAKRAAGHSR